MGLSESVQFAILSALFNAAVTWGVISTKLAWLRRDVDALMRSDRRRACPVVDDSQ